MKNANDRFGNSWRENEARFQLRQERQDYRAWVLGQRNDAPAPVQAQAVSDWMHFLFDGFESGDLGQLLVAFMFLVNPILLHGLSFAELEERYSFAPGSLSRAVARIREAFPLIQGGYAKAPKTEVARALDCLVRSGMRDLSRERDRSREQQRVLDVQEIEKLYASRNLAEDAPAVRQGTEALRPCA